MHKFSEGFDLKDVKRPTRDMPSYAVQVKNDQRVRNAFLPEILQSSFIVAPPTAAPIKLLVSTSMVTLAVGRAYITNG